MHPSTAIEREYLVRVHGQVEDGVLTELHKGVQLDDGEAHFDRIQFIGGEGRNQLYLCTLHEGRYREVRRLWEAVGVQVNRLKRSRFGPVALPKPLREGKSQALTVAEMKLLLQVAGLNTEKYLPQDSQRPVRKKSIRRSPNKRR